MDKLEINALKVSTKIGIHKWEQCINQDLFIDIAVCRDFSNCDDDINKTIDTEELCNLVTTYVETNSFGLIETIATNVINLIKEKFDTTSVSIRVVKPHAIKNANHVVISMTR